MNKDFSDFNRLPTDNSSTTNLKYDIVASKFMTGIENHKRRTANTPSITSSLGIIGAIVQLVIAAIIISVMSAIFIWKHLARLISK